MLDLLSIQCADVERSARFYEVVPAPLGGERIIAFEGPTIGFGVPPMPEFWLGPRATGDGFREAHIAFSAPDRDAVDTFFRCALAEGAEALHQPRLWPEYHHHDDGAAFVRAPDGNNVEAMCHAPEGRSTDLRAPPLPLDAGEPRRSVPPPVHGGSHRRSPGGPLRL